jgi:hypothetical protein
MSRVIAWISLTVAGFLLAGTLLHFPGSLDDDPWAPSAFVLGALTGLAIGGLQLLAIRQVLRRPWAWALRYLLLPLWPSPLPPGLGIAITHGLGDGVSAAVGYLPVALIGGIATGVLQAGALRTPLWAVATAAAFVVGIIGGHALAVELGFGSIFDEDVFPRHAIIAGLTGVLYALLTAPLLPPILRSTA